MALTTTPLATDNFSRFMAEFFDEREVIGVSTAAQAFFGRPETGSKTYFSDSSEVVEIEIIRSNEKTSALVPRGKIGKSLNNKDLDQEKWTNFQRVFPVGEDMGEITASQLAKRIAGEGQYEGKERLMRARELAVSLSKEMIRRQVRLFERLAMQSLLTGKQDVILGTTDTNLQYDFKRDSNLSITVSNAWNSGSQTIMADIDGACDKLREIGHVTPDMILVGGDAMDDMLADDDFQARADNRRFGLISIDMDGAMPSKFQKFVDGGMEWRGSLKTAKGRKLYIFTYTDIYTTDAGVATDYMDSDKAIIAYSGARADRYFGPADVLPVDTEVRNLYMDYFGFSLDAPMMPGNMKNASNVIMPEMFHFDAYKSKNNKNLTMRCQTAPIFATTQTDAIAVLKGLHT